MTRAVTCTMILLLAMLGVSSASISSALASVKKAELVKAGSTVELSKKKFTATGGELRLETTSGASVKCKKQSATGAVLNTHEAEESLTLNECKNSLGQKCKSAGAGAEEIKPPNKFKRLWGYLVGAAKAIIIIHTILGNGSEAVKFECSTVVNEVKGAFVVAIGASQEQVSKTSFVFAAAESKGVQGIKEFETVGGTVEKGITLEAKLLTSGASFEQAGQEASETVTFEEAAEFV